MASPITRTLKIHEQFSCLGAECEANCCKAGWNIEIGPEVLQRWQDLADSPLKQQLLRYVDTRNIEGVAKQVFAIDEHGSCFHLNENQHCCIHAELGSDYQPDSCDRYPRLQFSNDTTTINSMSLSCPEIARLIVDSSGTDIFDTVQEINLNRISSGASALEDYLDNWTHLAMQSENIPVSVRLYYLGKVINDLSNLAESGGLTGENIVSICSQYRDSLSVMEKAVVQGRLGADPVSAGWFWDIILHFSSKPAQALGRYYELKSPVPDSLFSKTSKSELDFRTLHTTVTRVLEGSSSGIAGLHTELAQYLRVLFVNMGFPWNPIGGNFIASYIKSVFHFASSWWFLALIAESKGALQKQDLVRVIYEVERCYFHDPMVANTMKKNPAIFNLDQYITAVLDLK